MKPIHLTKHQAKFLISFLELTIHECIANDYPEQGEFLAIYAAISKQITEGGEDDRRTLERD